MTRKKACGLTEPNASVSKTLGRLYIEGFVVDEIEKIVNISALDDPFNRNAAIEMRLKNQVLQTLEFHDLALEKNPTLSEDTVWQFEPFWSTFFCSQLYKDANETELEVSIGLREILMTFSNYLKGDEPTEDDLALDKRLDPGFLGGMIFTKQLAAFAFCSMKSARLGRVPRRAQEGDLVCIFLGSYVPYVIRPVGDGIYAFVGCCYCHGLMHGEAMNSANTTEMFTLV